MNNENTIYDNEKTQYNDERTQFQSHDEEATQYDNADNNNSSKSEIKTDTNVAAKTKKPHIWKKVAAGAGTGVVIGAAVSLLTSGTPVKQSDAQNGEEGAAEHPEWTDGEVQVANSVTDDMSFTEAFDAARAEVGAGGVFEWHGYIYSTYTEEEWNNMTAEQKDEYGNHFNWNDDTPAEIANNSHTSTAAHDVHASDEVEVVETINNGQTSQGQDDEILVNPSDNANDVAVVDVDTDVQVLGVVHDDDTGTNIAGVTVDGQEVVLIDVDNDQVFEVMGSDTNGDNQLSQNELVDISESNLTVNDLGGFSHADAPLYASSGNEIDYTNDIPGGDA